MYFIIWDNTEQRQRTFTPDDPTVSVVSANTHFFTFFCRTRQFCSCWYQYYIAVVVNEIFCRFLADIHKDKLCQLSLLIHSNTLLKYDKLDCSSILRNTIGEDFSSKQKFNILLITIDVRNGFASMCNVETDNFPLHRCCKLIMPIPLVSKMNYFLPFSQFFLNWICNQVVYYITFHVTMN